MKSLRLKSADDIRRIREAGVVIARIFDALGRESLAGVSTSEIDGLVEDIIRRSGSRPSFKTVSGYGHSCCISVNSEVVHGVPSPKRRLRDGDIVKIDIGVVRRGFFADGCRTFPVGSISPEVRRLLETAGGALDAAIRVMVPGKRTGDIGAAIQGYAGERGFSVVRDCSGHGVGFGLHELPRIPHFGNPGTGEELLPGMVLAVEPIINAGGPGVRALDDGWTLVTDDGSLSAQFEDTVAITGEGTTVLTRL